jgi:hypothetical protein
MGAPASGPAAGQCGREHRAGYGRCQPGCYRLRGVAGRGGRVHRGTAAGIPDPAREAGPAAVGGTAAADRARPRFPAGCAAALLDEPAAHLDPVMAGQIRRVVESLMAGRSAILVTWSWLAGWLSVCLSGWLSVCLSVCLPACCWRCRPGRQRDALRRRPGPLPGRRRAHDDRRMPAGSAYLPRHRPGEHHARASGGPLTTVLSRRRESAGSHRRGPPG